MRPEHAGRQVCDGEQVLIAAATGGLPPALAALANEFTALRGVLDTYGDLLVADAVYLLASGRGEQAAEAMEAAAGLGPPPALRVLHTDRGGRAVTTTVMAVLPASAPPAGGGPTSRADPAFGAFLEDALGSANTWTWEIPGPDGVVVVVTLDQLKLAPTDQPGLLRPIDTLIQPRVALEDAVRRVAGPAAGDISGGTARHNIGEVARLAALVTGEGGLPDFLVADAPAALAELVTRLEQLLADAQTLIDRLHLGGDAAAAALADAAHWGIVPEAVAPTDDPLAQAAMDVQRAQDAADLLEDRLTVAQRAVPAVPITDPSVAQHRLSDVRRPFAGWRRAVPRCRCCALCRRRAWATCCLFRPASTTARASTHNGSK